MRDSIALNRAVRNYLPLISLGPDIRPVSFPVAILQYVTSRWRVSTKKTGPSL